MQARVDAMMGTQGCRGVWRWGGSQGKGNSERLGEELRLRILLDSTDDYSVTRLGQGFRADSDLQRRW